MEIGGINSFAGILNNNIAEETKNKTEDSSFEQVLNNAVKSGDEKELKKVCQDFESILLNMMYKQMKSTIQKSNLIPSDTGTEIFESMLDEELTKQASKGTGLGLADVLYKQLSKQLKNSSD